MYRIERDSIGEKQVPVDAYYGVQALRAAENFPITGLKCHPGIIVSLEVSGQAIRLFPTVLFA